jgi:hypothetical protein
MGNGIFEPMFDPAVEKYTDDLIDERRRGKSHEEAIATAEKRIEGAWSSANRVDDQELVVDRFVRELPEVKRRLLSGFHADVTDPVKRRARNVLNGIEERAVDFVAKVARHVHDDELLRRETVERLRNKPADPADGPLLGESGLAKSINHIASKYARGVRGAADRVRTRLRLPSFIRKLW